MVHIKWQRIVPESVWLDTKETNECYYWIIHEWLSTNALLQYVLSDKNANLLLIFYFVNIDE